MLAQLIPDDGGNAIPITRDLTLVGRSREQCDLFLNRNSISKLHCMIVKTDGLLFVRDLGSTNGTKVNGQRIIRGALLPGDQLSFANIKFRVHLGPDAAPVTLHEATEPLSRGDVDDAGEDLGTAPPPDTPPPRSNPQGSLGHDSESDVRLLSQDELTD